MKGLHHFHQPQTPHVRPLQQHRSVPSTDSPPVFHSGIYKRHQARLRGKQRGGRYALSPYRGVRLQLSPGTYRPRSNGRPADGITCRARRIVSTIGKGGLEGSRPPVRCFHWLPQTIGPSLVSQGRVRVHPSSQSPRAQASPADDFREVCLARFKERRSTLVPGVPSVSGIKSGPPYFWPHCKV